VVLGRWAGAIDVAGAVAPTPTNIWEPIAKRQATQSPPNDGHSSPATRRLVSTKDGGHQSKGDSRTRYTFGDFSSLHSMSCQLSVPGLAQVGLDHFSARQGSRLTALETHQSRVIIQFIMYIICRSPGQTPHGSSYSACGIAGMYLAHVAQYIEYIAKTLEESSSFKQKLLQRQWPLNHFHCPFFVHDPVLVVVGTSSY
jgi:hypothetical protein